MPLAPGTQLGPYEILAPLGTGGMGEVYRARDTRLDRTVAIKILPSQFSSDPVRRQRFEREAKAISGLNHPHVCVLHDIGHQDGIDYLVMECVEGETVAKRLERGPLPGEQVLKYGSQIADALDKAHRGGVVHRDLKPGNIMLTSSGAKLLDFGLAKPSTSSLNVVTLTAAATQSTPVTQEGTIVGTFQYMSPEQIEGKELDGRSDIFSLGAVLYEMVTGRRAFEGKSQLSVASAILEKEPAPISSIKPLTPPGLDHAIGRSLAKDPDERWQAARDLALELKWIAEGGSQTGVSSSVLRPKRNRERLLLALAVILGAVSLASIVAYKRLARSTTLLVVSDIAPPKGTQFNFLVNGAPVLSPDGRAVAFAARDATGKASLWVRPLDGSPAQLIAGTEEAGSPFWSSDSRRIGFFTHYDLKTVEVSGGAPVTLTDPIAYGFGTWSRTGTILFVGAQGIYQVPASGGPAVPILRRDPSKYAFLFAVRFLPDNKHFLYQAANPGSPGDAYFASVDGKENRLLLQGSGQTTYASGFLLYVRGANLVAQPFEPGTGQLTGIARPIAGQVQQGALSAFFDVSQSGVLIYEPATGAPTVTQLAWFDRTGKRLAFIGVPAIHYDVRLSPDGRKLASSAGVPKSDIWVDDLERGVRMRLTFDPDTDNGIPAWSPDGKSLLFSTLRGSKAGVGIFRKDSNGAGREELVLPSDRPDREAWATDWSRDGRFLLFSRGQMANNSEADIWVLPLTGERKPIPFLRASASAYDAQFSPDGRWVAYTSRESGTQEVYVAPFEPAKVLDGGGTSGTPAGKWQVSSSGGSVPRWRRDGKELFYLGPENTIMAVEVEGTGASFNVGRSQRLFIAPVNPFDSTYDVAPDGQRFVMSASPEEESGPLVLMLNWTARVQEK
jgi:serine/threonine protein kinase/Tol biopolymer transport system component